MVRSFWADLRSDGPDLVHVKTSSGVNFYQNSLYCLEARLRNLPVLLQIHSGRFEAFYRDSILPLRAWIRHTLQSVDRVVVLSEHWRERLSHIAPSARVQVVPNGLGEEELSLLRDRRAATRLNQVLFLGAGRKDLNKDKGLEDLLAVLPRVASRHPTVRWVIAGLEYPDDVRRRLELAWEGAGSSLDRVRCLGIVDAREKLLLLRQSRILAMPSHFENMPNLLLEGMAAGMGIVATRVGAIPEMLDSGRGGIVIRPADREALAGGLDRLLSDPALTRRQGRHNEARVASHYTMSVVETLFENLYREVAGTRPALPHPVDRTQPSEASFETLKPIPMASDAGPLRAVVPPTDPRPLWGATWALAREAVRFSNGVLRPGKASLVSLPGPRAIPLPSAWSLEPDPQLVLPDCPAPQKRLN
jgi:glycosyltransferase involved in cell wall biosynthesis